MRFWESHNRIYMKHYRMVFVLSMVILVLSLFTTTVGILSNLLYLDNERLKLIWQSNDLITLIFALPLLGFLLVKSIKGVKVHLLYDAYGINMVLVL